MAYRKQRNYCVNLFRKEKWRYFASLNTKNVIDNKKFWKTIKPFFSDKSFIQGKVSLAENNEFLSNNVKIAGLFNEFFSNVVINLEIIEKTNIKSNIENEYNNPLQKIIFKYQKQPSTEVINNSVSEDIQFVFHEVDNSQNLKEIQNLKVSNISTKIRYTNQNNKMDLRYLFKIHLLNIERCLFNQLIKYVEKIY